MMQFSKLDLSNDVIEDGERVAAYLRACPVLVVAAGMDRDPLISGAPMAVPIGTASDGTYAWPLSVDYFARVHGIAPDDDLLRHIRERHYIAPDVPPDLVERLRAELAEASRVTGGSTSGDIPEVPPRTSGLWGDGLPG